MLALLVLLGLMLAIVIVVIIASLNSDLRALRTEFKGLADKVERLERGSVQFPPDLIVPHAVAKEASAAVAAPPPPHEGASAPLPPPQQPSVPLIVPPPPKRTRAEWEALIGGKLLNRIGALALIIGMGFFLKYAFDRNWITEWMRVGIGFGVGALLLAGGARFHRKGLPMFAQGLVGAGIAILYLSVYALFNFYHLVSQPVAFVLMAAVTVLTFGQALAYEALAVSVLGWLGGFLTPFLLSTGEARPVGLFSYIAMLDVGIIAVLFLRRKWAFLAPLSMLSTYIVYYLWYASAAGAGDGIAAVVFICLFWLLFHGYDVVAELRPGPAPSGYERVTAVAHLVLFYPVFYVVVERYFPAWLAAATCALAALYAVSYLLMRRSTAASPSVSVQYAITAVVLLVIGTEIQYADFVVIVAYAVEAVAFFWIGRTWSVKYLWKAGVGVLLWACLVVLATGNAFFFIRTEEFVLLWNLRVLAFLSIAGGSAAMLLLMHREGEPQSSSLHTVLHIVWVVFLFLLMTTETTDYFRRLAVDAAADRESLVSFQRFMVLGILWLAFGMVLLLGGQRERRIEVETAGFCLAVLGTCLVAIRGIAFDPVTAFVPLMNLRSLALVLATAMLAVCLIAVTREERPAEYRRLADWGINPGMWIRIMLVAVTLSLVSGEIRDSFERAIALRGTESPAALSDLENLKQVSLSSGWLLYSIVLMVAGLLRRVRSLRFIAMVLFGAAILKIFFYDLSFLETLYRIVSFIGLGIILLTVSYLYQRYRNVILDDAPKP